MKRRGGTTWRTRLLRGATIAVALGFGVLAWVYLTLPDVRGLRSKPPAKTAFMTLREAEARAEGRPFTLRYRWVPLSRISPSLRRAVLVAEDAAFFRHDGIDVEQLKDAIEARIEDGRPLRGASTITQQLAKNLYLSPSRSPLRKLRELLITRRLEAELSKARILELYLNVIEWGEGIFGAEAAARAYFGKPASQLSNAEAALLAGAIINPRVHSPARPTARLRARQKIILERMGYRTSAARPRGVDTTAEADRAGGATQIGRRTDTIRQSSQEAPTGNSNESTPPLPRP